MQRRVTALLVVVALASACANLSGLSGGGDAGVSSSANGSDSTSRSGTGPGATSGRQGSSRGGPGSSSSSDTSGSSTGSVSHDAGNGDAGSDASSGVCYIGGVMHPAGTPEPSSPCHSCIPGDDTASWSDDPDGTPCGTGGICIDGVCGSGCAIGGIVYTSSAPTNPNDSCQTCQPAMSTSAWSNLVDGTMCGGGQTCLNGECGLNCTVGTATVASGSLNPGNPCQLCEPGLTTTAWSGAVDGTSCAPGEVCTSAVCTSGCYVAGAFYSAGPNPGNACQLCTPSTSTTAWTDVANGTSTPCPAGELCNAGSCASGCYIAGIFYASGALDPGNACLYCHPATSTKLWHSEPDGTSCGAGEVCTSGLCGAGGGSGSSSGGGSGTGTGTP